MLGTRIALYATLGYLLDALGHDWTTWGFWAVLGLYWAAETVTRLEVIEQLAREVAAIKQRNKDTHND
jgi:hypothetical protein